MRGFAFGTDHVRDGRSIVGACVALDALQCFCDRPLDRERSARCFDDPVVSSGELDQPSLLFKYQHVGDCPLRGRFARLVHTERHHRNEQ